MKNDEILGKASIVRKNMQGVNGVELMPSQYNRILELGESNAPRLEYSEIDGDVKITREKDVENLLIKPLLKKLGYAEGDYETQMYIEIGNHNNALIPDFVLLPNKKRGHQSAFALIEAKLSIPTQSFLREVEIQARSYARQLGVKYSAIASKEMFWLYTPDDDYTKPVFHASWAELNDADVFSRLDKFIGKD